MGTKCTSVFLAGEAICTDELIITQSDVFIAEVDLSGLSGLGCGAAAREVCMRDGFMAVSFCGSFLFGQADESSVIVHAEGGRAVCLKASNPIL
jgi:hypothetical protein